MPPVAAAVVSLRSGLGWRPRRSLIAPYDLPILAGAMLMAVVSALSNENLLKFRDWMAPNILGAFSLGLVALTLWLAGRLAFARITQGRLDRRHFQSQWRRHLGVSVLLRTLRFVVAAQVMLLFYTTLKQRIPRLNPINCDPFLMQLEQWLHLGSSPAWLLAQASIPWWGLWLLDEMYRLWFFVKIPVLAYALTLPDVRKRDRFLTAYLSMWLLGTLVGLAMPSGGPFYIDRSGLFPPEHMPIAAGLQTSLYGHYLFELLPGRNGTLVFGLGLMAMPSLHVTAVVLYALFAWGEGQFWRWLSIAYAALIFIGSLVSGWHYAIDGYVGAAIAVGLWWLVGWVQQRASPSTDQFSALRSKSRT